MFFYKNGFFDPDSIVDAQWIISKTTLPNGQEVSHQVCGHAESDEVWLAIPGQRFILLKGEDKLAYERYLYDNSRFDIEHRYSSVGNFPDSLLPQSKKVVESENYPIEPDEDNFYPEAIDA